MISSALSKEITLNKLYYKGVENSFEYLTPFSYGQEIPDK